MLSHPTVTQAGTRSIYSHYVPRPQTRAHSLQMLSHPKLILNMLPGTYSLHPKLVHEAYVVTIFLHLLLVLDGARVIFFHCLVIFPQAALELTGVLNSC